MRFEWDDAKARYNLRRHGISFVEARTAFEDDEALLMPDPDHSREEERFILLGLSSELRVLVVVHCYRDDRGTIRLISARRATFSERAQYGARWMT